MCEFVPSCGPVINFHLILMSADCPVDALLASMSIPGDQYLNLPRVTMYSIL